MAAPISTPRPLARVAAGKLPPHDLDAEAAVLSTLLLDSRRLTQVQLRAADFYSEANGRIYSAIVELAADERAVDTVTVGGLLRDRQLLASIGGAAYLAQIVDATPSVRNVGAHAERVANLARDRRVLAAAHRIVADGYDPTESYAADAVRALRHAADETRPAEPTQPRPPDLAALCASMPGRFLRVPTGIHGLDLAMRGGLRTANLAVVGGAPGGHKTSIVGAMAYRWARDGVPTPSGRQPVLVSIMASDESRDGYLSRFGQIEQIERDALDSEDLAVSRPAWAAVAGHVAALDGRLTLWDPRDDQITVEQAAAMLAADPRPMERRVLIVDSLQAKCGWASDDAGHDGPRSQVDARLGAAMHAARRLRLCVVVLSELSRAAYRQRPAESGASRLATFKESGGIEYDVDQGIVLERVDDEGRVDAHLVKSRWGEVGAVVRLRRGGWLSYREEGIPPTPSPEERADSRIDDLVAELVLCLRRRGTPIPSRVDLNGLVRGERRLVVAAVSRAIAEGAILKGPGGYRPAQIGGSDAAE